MNQSYGNVRGRDRDSAALHLDPNELCWIHAKRHFFLSPNSSHVMMNTICYYCCDHAVFMLGTVISGRLWLPGAECSCSEEECLRTLNAAAFRP